MIFKNDEEYYTAIENFVRLRKNENTPVSVLDELYDALIEEEYSRWQDTAINSWIDCCINNEVFSDLFLNEFELRSKAIMFLEEKMIPHAEQIINGEIQSEE